MSKLKYNGLVYGLDYGIYQPDGAHYTYRTLTFLGHSPTAAARQVSDWYATHAFKRNLISPSSLLPGSNPVWGLVSPRILYPFLSIPAVALIGIPGMLIIPAISLLTLLLVATYLFKSKPIIGVMTAVSLSASPTVMRWMFVNYTDSLLTALFALTALHLSKNLTSSKSNLILVILIVTTSATRICIPIWFAISIVMFFNEQRRSAILTCLLSVISAVPALDCLTYLEGV